MRGPQPGPQDHPAQAPKPEAAKLVVPRAVNSGNPGAQAPPLGGSAGRSPLIYAIPSPCSLNYCLATSRGAASSF